MTTCMKEIENVHTTSNTDEAMKLFEISKKEMMDLFEYRKNKTTGEIEIDYASKSFQEFEEFLKNEYNRAKYKIKYEGYKVNPYNETHIFIGKRK